MAETVYSIRLHCVNQADRLRLDFLQAEERYDIVDTQTGNSLGWIKQAPDSRQEVELYWGKGGFMATVISPATDLRYFALPGASVKVKGVELALYGEPITSNPTKVKSPARPVEPQTETDQATILGAGLATRFERISGNSTECSKPGVPLVGRKTVIESIANGLARHGFTRLIVNTYFKPASIKQSLARSQASRVCYIDEAEPSGTAGGLRKMLTNSRYAELLDENKPLLVVQGDSVTDADYSGLMRAHVRHNGLVTIGCQLVAEEDVEKFGIIVTDCTGEDGQSGAITGFQEKPPRHLAKSRLGNTGFYIFSPRAYALVREIYEQKLAREREQARSQGQPEPQETALDFANDIFPEILKRVQEDPGLGTFWAQAVGGYWSDIGNPKQYLESIHDIYAGKVNLPLPENRDEYYRDGIVYWPGALPKAAEEGAELKGNVVVALPYREDM